MFEDGKESRDFVYVDDMVEATAAGPHPDVRGVHALNVGSGVATSVLTVAKSIAAYFDADVPVKITGDFRQGDIRDGLNAFLNWGEQREAVDASFDRSLKELGRLDLCDKAVSAPVPFG